MFEVGRLCYELARDIFEISEKEAEQMFVMGILHDIGYEFVSNQLEHAQKGGEILKSAGFQHWEPVARHGTENIDVSDHRDLVLNIADMSVGKTGKRIGFNKRLQDIENRYGKDSPQYVTSKNVIEKICEEIQKQGVSMEELSAAFSTPTNPEEK